MSRQREEGAGGISRGAEGGGTVPRGVLVARKSSDLDVFHRLLEDVLQRLGDFLGGLRAGSLEILDLGNAGLDALANESGLHFDQLGNRLDANQRLEVREAELGIGAQRGDRLQRQVAASGLGGLDPRLDGLLACLMHGDEVLAA